MAKEDLRCGAKFINEMEIQTRRFFSACFVHQEMKYLVNEKHALMLFS